MNISEHQISSIVEEVLQRITHTGTSPNINTHSAFVPSISIKGVGSFSQVDSAVRSALKAHNILVSLGMEKREKIITAIRHRCRHEVEYLAKLAVEETKLGNVKDK